MHEHSPGLTETDPRRLGELYEDVSPWMRAVLDLLVEHAPQRLTFQEVELMLPPLRPVALRHARVGAVAR